MQFNPETLKVSFANQIQTPSGTGDQKAARRRGSLSARARRSSRLQLWFDVTALADGEKPTDDVRKLTAEGRLLHHAREGGRQVRAHRRCVSSGDHSNSTA